MARSAQSLVLSVMTASALLACSCQTSGDQDIKAAESPAAANRASSGVVRFTPRPLMQERCFARLQHRPGRANWRQARCSG